MGALFVYMFVFVFRGHRSEMKTISSAGNAKEECPGLVKEERDNLFDNGQVNDYEELPS